MGQLDDLAEISHFYRSDLHDPKVDEKYQACRSHRASQD